MPYYLDMQPFPMKYWTVKDAFTTFWDSCFEVAEYITPDLTMTSLCWAQNSVVCLYISVQTLPGTGFLGIVMKMTLLFDLLQVSKEEKKNLTSALLRYPLPSCTKQDWSNRFVANLYYSTLQVYRVLEIWISNIYSVIRGTKKSSESRNHLFLCKRPSLHKVGILR